MRRAAKQDARAAIGSVAVVGGLAYLVGRWLGLVSPPEGAAPPPGRNPAGAPASTPPKKVPKKTTAHAFAAATAMPAAGMLEQDLAEAAKNASAPEPRADDRKDFTYELAGAPISLVHAEVPVAAPAPVGRSDRSDCAALEVVDGAGCRCGARNPYPAPERDEADLSTASSAMRRAGIDVRHHDILQALRAFGH